MKPSDEELTRKNIRLGLVVMGVFFVMVGMAFAAVPLYRLFCQVTGFAGTPQVGGVSSGVLDQEITVRFNADIARDLPWEFYPEQPQITVKIGQQALVTFYAKNNSDEPIEAMSIYNLLPETVGKYFHKVQCFCFDRQTLGPGEEATMPMVFFIDPKIVENPDLSYIKTITKSYTFFRADNLGGEL